MRRPGRRTARLFEAWSRCCHRLGLVPMNSVDVHEGVEVAVVLRDAGTGEDTRSSSPIVLLIDQPSASQVLAQPTGVKAVISWHDDALELEAATRAVLDGHCHISATAATAVLSALATTRTATPVSINRLTVPRDRCAPCDGRRSHDQIDCSGAGDRREDSRGPPGECVREARRPHTGAGDSTAGPRSNGSEEWRQVASTACRQFAVPCGSRIVQLSKPFEA